MAKYGSCFCRSRECYECNPWTIQRMSPKLAQPRIWHMGPAMPDPVMVESPEAARARIHNERVRILRRAEEARSTVEANVRARAKAAVASFSKVMGADFWTKDERRKLARETARHLAKHKQVA